MSGLQLIHNSIDASEGRENTTRHCVMFTLADEEYGIDMRSVKEIRAVDFVTKLPNVPDFVRGVIKFNNEVVPVIDLRLILGKSQSTNTSGILIIVVALKETKTKLMGLVIDDVLEPLEIANDDIKAVPDFGSEIDTSSIHGLVTIDDKVKVILDIEQMINREVFGENEH